MDYKSANFRQIQLSLSPFLHLFGCLINNNLVYLPNEKGKAKEETNIDSCHYSGSDTDDTWLGCRHSGCCSYIRRNLICFVDYIPNATY